jgi:hypothetical protein
MDFFRIRIINNIYNKFLNRDADESGINAYYYLTDNNANIKKLISIVTSSEEYKSTQNTNNVSSERISHIKNNIDLSILDPIEIPLTKIINMMILTDNDNYTKEKLILRGEMIKKNLIDIKNRNRNFSIFPHLEYYFNTEKFDTSLKEFKNFKYFVLYNSLWCLWKSFNNIEVPTDLSSKFIPFLNNINNFSDLFLCSSDFFINYLSIKISNKILNESEKNIVIKFILDENSEEAINYLHSLSKCLKDEENIIIDNKISELTIKLNRKPKVLIMVPYLESQNLYFLEKMMYHINKVKEVNINIDIDLALDNEQIKTENSDYTPWSKVKRIRNIMINKYPIHNYDYLYLIDSDILDYPHNFISRAIGLNPDGITAPLVLVQNTSLFYDIAGFQLKNTTSLTKNDILNCNYKKISINYQPPYVKNDNSRLVEVDCVGSTYVVPTYVFNLNYGDEQQNLLDVFNLFNVTNHTILENKIQYEDHPFYTDHYTLCSALKSNGGKILLDNGSVAYHADLQIYGEKWH